jgi:4-alpha-glucanotransferase
MRFPRASGIILHPTSLPDTPGIGDLGDAAYRFVDFLAAAGQRYWQVLPLGPTGYGDSPYQCFSAFAGNPLLISPQQLITEGLLEHEQMAPAPSPDVSRVDFGQVIPWKRALLAASFVRFRSHASSAQQADFARFCQDEARWIDDFTLFMALKDSHGGAPWWEWERPLRVRQAAALQKATARLADTMTFHRYQQWLFFHQWQALKTYATAQDVHIIGDIPIFAARDSADVWAHPHLFHLDGEGNPTIVAGVPPDYFSATGQLWGNPLYRWDVMKETGYAWWIERFRSIFRLVDVARVDHFRGFEAYWTVPADEETAIRGKWIQGPGADFFQSVLGALGDLPIIAEDLGFITPGVTALRDQFAFPGMKVLQFAFGTDGRNPYLPHNYQPNCVVYTGTHDNDTSIGWFQRSSTEQERAFVCQYLRRDGSDIAWDLIHLAWMSVADTAIAPLPDFLCLGSAARMNLPGTFGNNWQWRCPPDALSNDLATALRALTDACGRRLDERPTKPSVHVMQAE